MPSPETNSVLSSVRSGAVFITSTLVIIAAFRNTLTWHLQRFWGASGDFWQSQWDRVVDQYGHDQRLFWTCGTAFIAIVVYWSVGACFTIMDIINKPAALRRYKIQPGTNEPVDKKRLITAIAVVLFNQTVVTIPATYYSYSWLEWRGLPPLRELPTFHWVLFELACFLLVEEAGFYYTHRLMHNRFFYKHIHKKHHEWTSPISIVAIYCHPLEHLISNMIPLAMGPLLMGSHIATAWLWFTLSVINTLSDHSGYHLPFMSSSEYHDYHHLKFTQCYGVLGLLDRLHGTDTGFRNSRAYSRHYMMLNLVPAREAFPDIDKCNK